MDLTDNNISVNYISKQKERFRLLLQSQLSAYNTPSLTIEPVVAQNVPEAPLSSICDQPEMALAYISKPSSSTHVPATVEDLELWMASHNVPTQICDIISVHAMAGLDRMSVLTGDELLHMGMSDHSLRQELLDILSVTIANHH